MILLYSSRGLSKKSIYLIISYWVLAISYQNTVTVKSSVLADMKRFCCDDETGEVITYLVNEETGEPSIINKVPPIFHNPDRSAVHDFFNIPGYIRKTKKFQALKEKIMSGANTTSPRMFLLIATFMVFPSIVCVMLMLLETFLHVKCHKKNNNLKDPNVYYRSPFHVISSTFCGLCRECDMSYRIGQIQDQRRYHYDYLRGIAL